ncbi:MAG: halocyanin domain-containing protein [Natronomonas sp.]
MTNLSRRRMIGAAIGTVSVVTLAGCAGDDDTGDDDGDDADGDDPVPPEMDAFLTENEARLYDGTIEDATGTDEVVVAVGAGDGGLAFDPPALRIDAGTTVVWEWTGDGGAHNVASTEESSSDFESGSAVDDADETFEQSFDDDGLQYYRCTPHQTVGMYGAIEVLDG